MIKGPLARLNDYCFHASPPNERGMNGGGGAGGGGDGASGEVVSRFNL